MNWPAIWQRAWDSLVSFYSPGIMAGLAAAFLIAGALNVFVPKSLVLKFLGSRSNQFLAYSLAIAAGIIVSVWSCTAIPLFSGIRKRGAGLGPAIAFLLSAPALDIVPIILTFRLFGAEFGAARLIGIIAFGVIIGVTMSSLFRERQTAGNLAGTAVPEAEVGKRWWVQVVLFGLLVAIMVFSLDARWLVAGILLVVFVPFFVVAFSRDDFRAWMVATYQFVRSIIPWILVGSLGAAVIAGLVPSGLVYDLTGGSSARSGLIASFLGSLMYICPPAEILVTKAFVQLGMGLGPALAFILTGPAVSFPSMIILVRIIGWKKSLVYVVMLIVLATSAGFAYGLAFPKGG